MLDAYYFNDMAPLPNDIRFNSREDLLAWSREWPKRSIYLYDEPQHFYRDGREYLITVA